MAYDERYATADRVKRELPFNAEDFPHLSSGEFHELLVGDTGLLERESKRLESWANTTWTTTTVTESLSRPTHVDPLKLPLPHLPIDSVGSVSTEDAGSLTETTDYHVLETHLRIEEDSTAISAWPTGFQEVTVTWDYGFDTVPPEVTGALVRLVRHALDQIVTDGLESESLDGASYSYRVPGELRREIKLDIGPHSAPSYYGAASVS